MKLVLDTGILVSALIKESSANRHILLMPAFDFYLPEYAMDEINRHRGKISELSGLTGDELSVLFSLLMERVTIVPALLIKPHIRKAASLIGRGDEKDFSEISDVRIWSTKDILEYLAVD